MSDARSRTATRRDAPAPRLAPRFAARAGLLALVAGVCAALPAAAEEVKRVPAPAASMPLPDLSKVGRAHSLAVRDARLYVGASEGLAAIDPSGKVLWTLELPTATARNVEADGDGVAYTSYEIAGLAAGKGTTAALLWGDPSRKIDYVSADAGVVTLDGQPMWTSRFEEASALSAPALGKSTVAVVTGKSVRLFDRAKGTKVADVGMFTNWLGISENYNSRVAVTPALAIGEDFVAGHQSWFKKVDAKGEELVAARAKIQQTGGPLLCKDKLLLGEAAYPMGNIFTGKKARFWAVGPKAEVVWMAYIDDELGGVASLACDDDLIYAASNSIVVAVKPDGKQVWEAKSERSVGQLFPGTHRGVVRIRDIFGNAGPAVARAVTAGRQMVVAGPYLYITTRSKPEASATTDVVTVLDAKSGAFVEAYETNTVVIDMAVFGKDLVLATGDGLKLIGLKP